MAKQNVGVYAYSGELFSLERKEILTPASTVINLEKVPSEISQAQKDGHWMMLPR